MSAEPVRRLPAGMFLILTEVIQCAIFFLTAGVPLWIWK